jgi:hypothetical protein
MTRIKTATDDVELAAKIVDAMKEYDAADATRKEKAIAAGKLLNEAHKRHPTDKAFGEFLELAGGIQIRRARDLIALAVGRKDFEQHQIENAAAAQRHRDKLKAEKIEREKAKAALPKPDPKPKPKGKPEHKSADPAALRNAASTGGLLGFEMACNQYLPQLNEADLKKANAYFNKGAWKSKTSKREAA